MSRSNCGAMHNPLLGRVAVRDASWGSYARPRCAALTIAMTTLAACSGSEAPTSAPPATHVGGASVVAQPAQLPTNSGAFKIAKGSEDKTVTICESIFTPSDFANIITGGEYTLLRYSMTSHRDGGGCGISADAGFTAFLDISSDKSTRQRFAAFGIDRRAVTGVGDVAYEWGPEKSNIPNATETTLAALKGDTDCFVSLIQHDGPIGANSVVPKSHDEIVKRLSGLCAKIFAK